MHSSKVLALIDTNSDRVNNKNYDRFFYEPNIFQLMYNLKIMNSARNSYEAPYLLMRENLTLEDPAFEPMKSYQT
jgi:hypothetical protein